MSEQKLNSLRPCVIKKSNCSTGYDSYEFDRKISHVGKGITQYKKRDRSGRLERYLGNN